MKEFAVNPANSACQRLYDQLFGVFLRRIKFGNHTFVEGAGYCDTIEVCISNSFTMEDPQTQHLRHKDLPRSAEHVAGEIRGGQWLIGPHPEPGIAGLNCTGKPARPKPTAGTIIDES